MRLATLDRFELSLKEVVQKLEVLLNPCLPPEVQAGFIGNISPPKTAGLLM